MKLWILSFNIVLFFLYFRTIDALPTYIIKDLFNQDPIKTIKKSSHLPVLLWHGMGDSYNSEAMLWAADQLKKGQPDLDIYSIYIDKDSAKDKKASILGDVMTQVGDVCEEIKQLDIDFNKGFNAIGFSQGGLFIRALVQTCDVKFRNVIAVGSPQNGFVDLPPCEPDSFLCRKRNEFLKSRMYSDYLQENNVQAQYFRDVTNYETYLEKSTFLKYVNNELFRDLNYYERMINLNKFVMIMFEKDETLVPKETAWFYDVDAITGDLVSFKQTDSYLNDLVGMKKLNEQGKIDFLKIDDLHLKMSDDDLIYLAKTYL
jgi:palmitoyl-protein thioesterase